MGTYTEEQIPQQSSSHDGLGQLCFRYTRRSIALEGPCKPIKRDKAGAKAVDQQHLQSVNTPQLHQPGCAAKVPCESTHIRAVVNSISDPRRAGREKMVMRWVGRHAHAAGDERRPPHSLLLGNGRDGSNTWAHEADESDTLFLRSYDVPNRGVRGGLVRRIEV